MSAGGAGWNPLSRSSVPADVTRLASELGTTPEQVQALMSDLVLAKLVADEAARLTGSA
jgi:hypothetical protein